LQFANSYWDWLANTAYFAALSQFVFSEDTFSLSLTLMSSSFLSCTNLTFLHAFWLPIGIWL